MAVNALPFGRLDDHARLRGQLLCSSALGYSWGRDAPGTSSACDARTHSELKMVIAPVAI